jgi:hypothetical protein
MSFQLEAGLFRFATLRTGCVPGTEGTCDLRQPPTDLLLFRGAFLAPSFASSKGFYIGLGVGAYRPLSGPDPAGRPVGVDLAFGLHRSVRRAHLALEARYLLLMGREVFGHLVPVSVSLLF